VHIWFLDIFSGCFDGMVYLAVMEAQAKKKTEQILRRI